MKMGMNLLSVVCRPQVHKNTNVPLILKVRDVMVFYLGKTPNRPFQGVFRGGQDFFYF